MAAVSEPSPELVQATTSGTSLLSSPILVDTASASKVSSAAGTSCLASATAGTDTNVARPSTDQIARDSHIKVFASAGADKGAEEAASLIGSFRLTGKASWERGVGTFEHQKDLPSLPVPELDDTLDKYLKSVEPLLSPSELEHTKSVVEEFREGAGKKLQALLEERAGEERNWLEEWWEYLVYLRARYPIAVWINWHGVLPGSWGAHGVRQAEAAAMFTRHIANFRLQLLDGTLPAESILGNKMCMHQFTRMFNSVRAPGEGMDEIRVFPDRELTDVVVMRGGALYSFPVVDPKTHESLPHWHLVEQFERVRAGSALFEMGSEPPVAMLTAQERDEWARARAHLESISPINRASLDAIDRAIVVLVLDDGPVPRSTKEAAGINLVGREGKGDRWFDKPIQMVVYENGTGGVNGEHTWADAMAVVSLFERVTRTVEAELRENGGLPSSLPPAGLPASAGGGGGGSSSAASAASAPPSAPGGWSGSIPAPGPEQKAVLDGIPAPRKLAWELDVPATQSVELAATHLREISRKVDMETFDFRSFGKAFMKRYKLIPDFFVQMAIQLAHYRLHGRLVATYESCHTRLFYHGRTETIRTTSLEVRDWLQAMEEGSKKSDSERFELLQTSIKAHKAFAKDCLMGKGIDRHLLGMYILSEMGAVSPKPSLFTDKSWTESTNFRLSTSNVSMRDGVVCGGFMAMKTDGYGVCYAIRPDRIFFSITSNTDCPDTKAIDMREALAQALGDMQKLCCTRNVAYVAQSKL